MDSNLTMCNTIDVTSCILAVYINRLEIMNQKWSVLNIKCTGQVDLVKNLLNLQAGACHIFNTGLIGCSSLWIFITPRIFEGFGAKFINSVFCSLLIWVLQLYRKFLRLLEGVRRVVRKVSNWFEEKKLQFYLYNHFGMFY